MRLIAEGTSLDALPQYEGLLAEGEKGEVRFYLSQEMGEDDIQGIKEQILSQGVVLTGPIVQDAGIVVVRFEKRIAPLMIIALAVGVVVVVGGILLGWQLFSWIGKVPWWAWFLGGFATLWLIMGKTPLIVREVRRK